MVKKAKPAPRKPAPKAAAATNGGAKAAPRLAEVKPAAPVNLQAPPAQPGAQPSMRIIGQYLKDLSFENPNAPQALAPQQSQPDINISVNVNARNLTPTDFEVELQTALEKIARSDTNSLNREAASLCLTRIKPLANLPAQEPAYYPDMSLEEKDNLLKYYAASAGKGLGKSLLALMKDPDHKTRILAFSLAGNIKDSYVKTALLKYLDVPKNAILAEQALLQSGNSIAFDLLALLTKADSGVSEQTIIRMVGQVLNKEANLEIMRALFDPASQELYYK